MTYTLSEHESKELLRQAGMSVPPEHLVATVDEALRAAAQLGGAVALKLCGRGIAHKTERNLVRLGVATADDVRAAGAELLAARQPDDVDAALLVCPMISGRRELIAGLVRDPTFGPCVMLGLGGIFAEVVRDVAFAVAPLRDGDAEALIDALAHPELLGPFRGEPGIDRAALVHVLETLGQLGVDRPEIRSIDINPLIVAGSTPV